MRTLFAAAAVGGFMVALIGHAPAAESTPPAPAMLHVTLPAAATLTINGEKTTSTAGERWFITPALDADKGYACTLRAEFVRDGAVVSVERKVTVRAGRQANVTIGLPSSNGFAYSSFYDDESAPVSAPQSRLVRRARPVEWPTAWTGN